MTTIKAITFDFWETLYHRKIKNTTTRMDIIRAALTRAGRGEFSDDQIMTGILAARESWSRSWIKDQTTFGSEKWLQIVFEDLGVKLPQDIFLRSVKELEEMVLVDSTEPVPNIVAVLPGLAEKYRLGIISDTGASPGRVLRQKLAQDGILEYFAAFAFSDEIGHSKPHPKVFKAVLQGLQVEPENAVHIGDFLHTDVAGARSAGMLSIRYTGIRDDENSDFAEADMVLRDYADLPAMIERL
jgi:putative hydrolase of the HAD superfamily